MRKFKDYIRELSTDILDEHNVFVELLLVWIGIMLTSLVILSILGILAGG